MSNEELDKTFGISNGAGIIVRRHENIILCKYTPKGYKKYWDIHLLKDNMFLSNTIASDNIYDEDAMVSLFFKMCKA